MVKMATATICALAVASTASAATVYWTPAHMAKALTALRAIADGCVQTAAEAAVVAKHGMQVNLACTQGATIYSWSCTSANGGPYTVAFTKGLSAWTTTVTP